MAASLDLMRSYLKDVMCAWCSSIFSSEFNNSAYSSPCCSLALCHSCVILSGELHRCVYCKVEIFQPVASCFKKHLTLTESLDKTLMRSNIQKSDVIKNKITIGMLPNGIRAEFLNLSWLPCFDEQLGHFIQQIHALNVSDDPHAILGHSQLSITFQQPYLYTKFLFALNQKVIRHNGESYVLCSTKDQGVYASDWFRQKIQKFDLVCVPHGQFLEPLQVIIEGLPENLNCPFVHNCNSHRSQIKPSHVFVKMGFTVIQFNQKEELEAFVKYVLKNGLQIEADREDPSAINDNVKSLERKNHIYYQWVLTAFSENPNQIIFNPPPVSVTNKFFQAQDSVNKKKSFGRGQRSYNDNEEMRQDSKPSIGLQSSVKSISNIEPLDMPVQKIKNFDFDMDSHDADDVNKLVRGLDWKQEKLVADSSSFESSKLSSMGEIESGNVMNSSSEVVSQNTLVQKMGKFNVDDSEIKPSQKHYGRGQRATNSYEKHDSYKRSDYNNSGVELGKRSHQSQYRDDQQYGRVQLGGKLRDFEEGQLDEEVRKEEPAVKDESSKDNSSSSLSIQEAPQRVKQYGRGRR